MRRVIVCVMLAVLLCGCDIGFRQLGPTECAVKFRMLPRWIGGGIAHSTGRPGEMLFVLPWEKLYRFDTKVVNLEWGAKGTGSTQEDEDYVQTRAMDGNEVALSVGVQYQVSKDPEALRKLVQSVATSDREVEELVTSAARADIRTHMNHLATEEFFDNKAKYGGEAQIKEALRDRLTEYGIIVKSVNLREHRFERALPDGSIDRRYQERINQVQALEQEVDRENRRIETVKADKEREKAEMQGQVNRQVEEAGGIYNQAVVRGKAYEQVKGNEAQGILATGQAEAEGITLRVAALDGPGGRDLVKLEVAKQLKERRPKFVVVDSGSAGSGIAVQRLDTNELLKQIGILEGLKAVEPARDKDPAAQAGDSQQRNAQ